MPPPGTISQDTKVALPLWAIASIIVALFTGGAAVVGVVVGYTRLQDKADLTVQRVAKLEEAEQRRSTQDTSVALHFQQLDLTYEAIRARLDSIDRKLSPRSARGDDR